MSFGRLPVSIDVLQLINLVKELRAKKEPTASKEQTFFEKMLSFGSGFNSTENLPPSSDYNKKETPINLEDINLQITRNKNPLLTFIKTNIKNNEEKLALWNEIFNEYQKSTINLSSLFNLKLRLILKKCSDEIKNNLTDADQHINHYQEIFQKNEEEEKVIDHYKKIYQEMIGFQNKITSLITSINNIEQDYDQWIKNLESKEGILAALFNTTDYTFDQKIEIFCEIQEEVNALQSTLAELKEKINETKIFTDQDLNKIEDNLKKDIIRESGVDDFKNNITQSYNNEIEKINKDLRGEKKIIDQCLENINKNKDTLSSSKLTYIQQLDILKDSILNLNKIFSSFDNEKLELYTDKRNACNDKFTILSAKNFENINRIQNNTPENILLIQIEAKNSVNEIKKIIINNQEINDTINKWNKYILLLDNFEKNHSLEDAANILKNIKNWKEEYKTIKKLTSKISELTEQSPNDKDLDDLREFVKKFKEIDDKKSLEKINSANTILFDHALEMADNESKKLFDNIDQKHITFNSLIDKVKTLQFNTLVKMEEFLNNPDETIGNKFLKLDEIQLEYESLYTKKMVLCTTNIPSHKNLKKDYKNLKNKFKTIRAHLDQDTIQSYTENLKNKKIMIEKIKTRSNAINHLKQTIIKDTVISKQHSAIKEFVNLLIAQQAACARAESETYNENINPILKNIPPDVQDIKKSQDNFYKALKNNVEKYKIEFSAQALEVKNIFSTCTYAVEFYNSVTDHVEENAKKLKDLLSNTIENIEQQENTNISEIIKSKIYNDNDESIEKHKKPIESLNDNLQFTKKINHIYETVCDLLVKDADKDIRKPILELKEEIQKHFQENKNNCDHARHLAQSYEKIKENLKIIINHEIANKQIMEQKYYPNVDEMNQIDNEINVLETNCATKKHKEALASLKNKVKEFEIINANLEAVLNQRKELIKNAKEEILKEISKKNLEYKLLPEEYALYFKNIDNLLKALSVIENQKDLKINRHKRNKEHLESLSTRLNNVKCFNFTESEYFMANDFTNVDEEIFRAIIGNLQKSLEKLRDYTSPNENKRELIRDYIKNINSANNLRELQNAVNDNVKKTFNEENIALKDHISRGKYRIGNFFKISTSAGYVSDIQKDFDNIINDFKSKNNSYKI